MNCYVFLHVTLITAQLVGVPKHLFATLHVALTIWVVEWIIFFITPLCIAVYLRLGAKLIHLYLFGMLLASMCGFLKALLEVDGIQVIMLMCIVTFGISLSTWSIACLLKMYSVLTSVGLCVGTLIHAYVVFQIKPYSLVYQITLGVSFIPTIIYGAIMIETSLFKEPNVDFKQIRQYLTCNANTCLWLTSQILFMTSFTVPQLGAIYTDMDELIYFSVGLSLGFIQHSVTHCCISPRIMCVVVICAHSVLLGVLTIALEVDTLRIGWIILHGCLGGSWFSVSRGMWKNYWDRDDVSTGICFITTAMTIGISIGLGVSQFLGNTLLHSLIMMCVNSVGLIPILCIKYRQIGLPVAEDVLVI